MTCPRCHTEPLVERERRAVSVDVCRGCGGVWLDRGELDRTIDDAIDEHRVRHDVVPSRVRFYGDPPPAAPHAREGTPAEGEGRPAATSRPSYTRRAS